MTQQNSSGNELSHIIFKDDKIQSHTVTLVLFLAMNEHQYSPSVSLVFARMFCIESKYVAIDCTNNNTKSSFYY